MDIAGGDGGEGGGVTQSHTARVSWLRLPNGTDVIRANAVLDKELGPLGFRLRVSKIDPLSKQMNLVLDYRFKNICQSFMGKEIARLVPTMNSHRCFMNKGRHSINVDDLDKFIHLLAGDSFFMGTFRTMFDLIAGCATSVLCVRSIADILPPL